jgi:TonB family protein
MKTIIHRTLAGTLLLCVVLFGAAPGRAQTNETPQAASPSASSRRILTKDPDYLKLLAAPQKDDFLRAYSEGYRQKSAEIEAKVAGITDAADRPKARADEWANVSKYDLDKFTYEADLAFREAKIQFARKHQDAWMDVGRVAYDENSKSLVVKSTPTSPIDAYFHVPMDEATINQIYEKFRQIAGPEIDRQAHDYVSKSGANSPCQRNADWCFQIKREDLEKAFRSERMMVVAQGDLEQEKIDRYVLVDYETETVLFEFDPHISILNGVSWRFSIGPAPIPPKEPEPVAVPVQPAGVAPAAGSQTSPPQPAEVAGKGSGAEPAPNATGPAGNPPARISVPANVTSASIVTRVKPVYPPEARARQIQGDVVLRAIIDKEGKISEVRVLEGDELLAKSALEAVRQWRYKPMLSNGEPTEVETTITITFSLQE